MARPLTKCKKDGTRYVRPKAVETEIDVALREDRATQRVRLLVTDPSLAEYLRSECLVHLIRDARRRDDQYLLNTVLPVLLGRCEAILRAKIAGDLPNAGDLVEDVLGEFSELIARDGTGEHFDELDFYECRFNLAFRTLRVDAVRRDLRRLERAPKLPDHGYEDASHAYDGDALARVSEAFQTPATQESRVFRRELWGAIRALPSDERKAVILCSVLGYKAESEDPEEITAATRCHCTGRTIRNRLSRAAKTLSRFKEEV